MGVVIRVTRRRVFVGILAAVILFVGIGSFTVVYTATPKSCATCHNMVPFYESWSRSRHHEVGCIDCHYPPGVEGSVERQLAGLSQVMSYMSSSGSAESRQQAQVPDAGCLSGACHQRESLRKPLLFGKYVLEFRHDLHFGPLPGGFELRCASCHMRLAGSDQHFDVNAETCWICHFGTTPAGSDGGNRRCLECHGLALRLNRDLPEDHTRTLAEGISCQVCHGTMVEGRAEASKSACGRCHLEERPDELLAEPAVLHGIHTRKVKIDCSECHGVPAHVSRTRLQAEVPGCASCHPRYHSAQSQLWTGTGFEGVPEKPNPMFPSGLTCEACHITLTEAHGHREIGETRVVTEESCRACHPHEEKGDYAKLIGPWKAVGGELVSQLRTLYAAAAPRLGGLPDDGPESPGGRYRQGLLDLDLLEAGGPVHNVWYARDVAYRALHLLAQATAAADPGAPLPELRDRSSAIPADCLECHFGVDEDLKAFDQDFSHARHTLDGKVACSQCHSGLADGHGGTLLEGAADCSACHHGPASRAEDGQRSSARCATCHALQTEIYDGVWERPAEAKPNVMAAAVHCIQCHFPGEAASPVLPGEADCRACHPDGDLASLLPAFRKNLAERRGTVEALLATAETIVRLPEEDRAFLAHVRRTLGTLARDGSGGVHNPALVDEVLTGFARRLGALVGR